MLQDGGTTTLENVVKDTTTQAFVKDVIEESRQQPVLVDFWAPWCGPCRQLTPILEKTVKAAKGKAKLVKMNIDEHPAIPGQMGIQSIPAVIAFVNGQPVDGFMGALPEGQVTAFIERLIKDRVGGEEKDLLKQADALLADGDATGAVDLYAQVLAQEPGNVPALAGLARCYVRTGALMDAFDCGYEPGRQGLRPGDRGSDNHRESTGSDSFSSLQGCFDPPFGDDWSARPFYSCSDKRRLEPV